MKKLLFLLVFGITVSCNNNPEKHIEHVNGYWEIKSVTFPDGTTKDFTINQTVDFITINDSLNGFRKKIIPTFGGNYETSKDAETLTLKIENDSLNIYYKTKYASWKETILKADENQLKIINANKNVYLYKRFTPINLE